MLRRAFFTILIISSIYSHAEPTAPIINNQKKQTSWFHSLTPGPKTTAIVVTTAALGVTSYKVVPIVVRNAKDRVNDFVENVSNLVQKIINFIPFNKGDGAKMKAEILECVDAGNQELKEQIDDGNQQLNERLDEQNQQLNDQSIVIDNLLQAFLLLKNDFKIKLDTINQQIGNIEHTVTATNNDVIQIKEDVIELTKSTNDKLKTLEEMCETINLNVIKSSTDTKKQFQDMRESLNNLGQNQITQTTLLEQALRKLNQIRLNKSKMKQTSSINSNGDNNSVKLFEKKLKPKQCYTMGLLLSPFKNDNSNI